MPTRVRSIAGYFAGGGLHPEDAVGEAGVAQVLPADVVERLRPPVRPHAVDLHDDEAQLGQRLRPMKRRERLGHERALRPGVDLLDHRVLLRRVEVRRPEDHAVDVGLAVAPLGDEPLGGLPAGRQQGRRVGPLQLADELAVRRRGAAR